MHDFVPILSGHDSEQSDDAVGGRFEVGLSRDAFTELDRPEQYDSHQRVKENEQKHAHDDEEAFVYGHGHRQHQHFERRMFAGYGEKAQNDHDESKRVADFVA